MLVEASGCSSDSCAVALKLCSNEFSMALSLLSYSFAAAGSGASAALHATRMLQHALPPPWLQQQNLLHRQVSQYLQLRRQEQKQRKQELLRIESVSSLTISESRRPQEQQKEQQRPQTPCTAAVTKGGEDLEENCRGGVSVGSAATAAASTVTQQQWVMHRQQSMQQQQQVPAPRPSRIAPVPLRPGQNRRLISVTSPTAACVAVATAQQQSFNLAKPSVPRIFPGAPVCSRRVVPVLVSSSSEDLPSSTPMVAMVDLRQAAQENPRNSQQQHVEEECVQQRQIYEEMPTVHDDLPVPSTAKNVETALPLATAAAVQTAAASPHTVSCVEAAGPQGGWVEAKADTLVFSSVLQSLNHPISPPPVPAAAAAPGTNPSVVDAPPDTSFGPAGVLTAADASQHKEAKVDAAGAPGDSVVIEASAGLLNCESESGVPTATLAVTVCPSADQNVANHDSGIPITCSTVVSTRTVDRNQQLGAAVAETGGACGGSTVQLQSGINGANASCEQSELLQQQQQQHNGFEPGPTQEKLKMESRDVKAAVSVEPVETAAGAALSGAAVGQPTAVVPAAAASPLSGTRLPSGQVLALRLPDGRLLHVSLPPDAALDAACGATVAVSPAAATGHLTAEAATAAATIIPVTVAPSLQAPAASKGLLKAKPPGPPPKGIRPPPNSVPKAEMGTEAARSREPAQAVGADKAVLPAPKAKAPGKPPAGRPPPSARTGPVGTPASATSSVTTKAPGPPPKGPPAGRRPPPPKAATAAAMQKKAAAEAALPLGRRIHWKALPGDKIHVSFV